MPGNVGVLTPVQDGREQRFVGAQVVKFALAHVGTEVADLRVDRLEGQIEGKLPHPLNQRFGVLFGPTRQAIVNRETHHCTFGRGDRFGFPQKDISILEASTSTSNFCPPQ